MMDDDVMIDLPGLMAVVMSIPKLWYIRAISINPSAATSYDFK